MKHVPNPQLIAFIKEARKRGFDDLHIKAPLLKKGWPLHMIDLAFASLNSYNAKKTRLKNQVVIFLDDELLAMIEKRAKKNMMTLPEQIEDILRRSSINLKKKPGYDDKNDDKLLNIFSRRKHSKKNKKNKINKLKDKKLLKK